MHMSTGRHRLRLTPTEALVSAGGPVFLGFQNLLMRIPAGGVLIVALFFAIAGLARAEALSPLEMLDIDTRAMIAAAACVVPPDAQQYVDPDHKNFTPTRALSYLETNQDGHYAASTVNGGLQIYYTILRHEDEAAAAKGLAAWTASGDAPKALGWGGHFAAFYRGQGLLGVAMAGGGIVARGQSGRWHFEVSVTPEELSINPAADDAAILAVAADAMRLLAAKAEKYWLFEHALVVELEMAGQVSRLAPGQPFQIPLKTEGETEAVFILQVQGSGKGMPGIRYAASLSGPLAGTAEFIQDGARQKTLSVEVSSISGDPVRLVWVFPPTTNAGVAPLLDGGDLGLRLKVEAKLPPKALP